MTARVNAPVITPVIASPTAPARALVVTPTPGAAPPRADVGGKAHNLARLAGIPGVVVPPWIAIAAAAFDAFVLEDASDATDPAALRARVAALALPPALADALRPALAANGLLGAMVAVRSSATVEDAASASFAGQFASVLGVRVDDDLAALWDAVRTVWLSAFSAHALSYAAGQSGGQRVRMAVLIQQLAPARAAGVAFSMDPVTGDGDVAVLSATYGLGELLVAGDVDGDTMRVRRDGHVDAVLADKEHALLRRVAGARASGTVRVPVPASLRRAPVISDDQARTLATLARRIAESLGAPQDVEWSIGTDGAADVRAPSEGEALYILQARPITATARREPGERRVWDNSNIVESFSGVTTPLTFSFASFVYEQVYRQFCELLGVRQALVDAHRHTFANMLGLVSGRVYYNLLNWYRVLALLPGYALNREFMERMMGVRERLTEPPPPPGAGERWRDAGRLSRSVWRLWREHRRLDREIAAFFARTNRALAPVEQADLDTWKADELVALYRRLQADLLMHWQAPLVNDFFAMIWFGLLGRLIERWLPGAEPTLVNSLLVAEGGVVSTEPARRIMGLAATVSADPALRDAFVAEPDDDALLRRLRADGRHAVFVAAFDAYLARFGDRCVGELKLETITSSEDPGYIIGMTRAYLEQPRTGASDDPARDAATRRDAEATVRARLTGMRRRTFFMVLRHARARIRDRENLRFERTRVFGAVRRIFRGLGHRLHELGRLAHHRDIFHLTVEEVFATVEGRGVTGDLRPLVALRQAEFSRWAGEPSPPERFETRGPPVAPLHATLVQGASDGSDLQGLGCCPGIVRAPVRVVHDPSQVGELRGRILVADRTDPGWTLLFPIASGLLVQRGSLLSHSAIVAREVGLPCIVGIPRLMEQLADGEWVEMDGSTGSVRRIAPPGAPA